MKQSFDDWWKEVIRIGQLLEWPSKALLSLDKKAWKGYYSDDYTAAEAWREEYRD